MFEVLNLVYTPPERIDPALAALIGVIITGIVGLVGHRVGISKVRNERSATHVEGFEKLTKSLQAQIDTMKKDLTGIHSEMSDVKERNSELAQENMDLKSQLQTKNEIIRGFTKWHELWKAWFAQLVEDGKLGDLAEPPEYTWQMKDYLADIQNTAEAAQKTITDGEKK